MDSYSDSLVKFRNNFYDGGGSMKGLAGYPQALNLARGDDAKTRRESHAGVPPPGIKTDRPIKRKAPLRALLFAPA